MTLIRGPRHEARVLAMRPSPRGGLYTLASAWQATHESNVRPFARPTTPANPGEAESSVDAEPPYWPDGPSAA
jgi:hypothetical protein